MAWKKSTSRSTLKIDLRSFLDNTIILYLAPYYIIAVRVLIISYGLYVPMCYTWVRICSNIIYGLQVQCSVIINYVPSVHNILA